MIQSIKYLRLYLISFHSYFYIHYCWLFKRIIYIYIKYILYLCIERKKDAFLYHLYYLRKFDFKPIKEFIVKIIYGGFTHDALYKFLKARIKILLRECLAETNFKNYKKSPERKVARRGEGRWRAKWRQAVAM